MHTFIQLRKEFHQIAELSGKEYQTSKKVITVLEGYDCEIISPIGNTGVLAIFDSGREGKTVTFRAELDALPIQEINTFKHQSITEGVSHKCGHDGHLTTLLNLAHKLNQNPPLSGRVILLFQSAEENGEGALAMLNDEKLKNYHPDFIFAYHNLPGYPLKKVVYKYNSFTAAVVSVIVKLKGRTAHAAEPEHGENPAKAMAQITLRSLEEAHNDINHPEFSVITPVYQLLGTQDYGISAGYGEVHLTLRCWTQQALDGLIQKIENIACQEASNENLEVSLEFTQAFQANENDLEAVSILEEIIIQNGYDNLKRSYPFKWGEDFGLFTQKFKGAMFGIGSGESCPALHNPDYDFPDELLDYASNLFFDIQKSILG